MNGSNIQVLDDCQAELTNIKNFINENPLHSMVKYLVSYSVIKSCGTIEIVYKDIIYCHLIENANAEAITYFSRNIKDSSSNPKFENMCSLLKQLNRNWNSSFKSTVDELNKQSLNSLVELRNQLAHGIPITSSIDDVITYFANGRSILNVLDSIVNNNNK